MNINNIRCLYKIFLVYPQSYPHELFDGFGHGNWAELSLILMDLTSALTNRSLELIIGPRRTVRERWMGS